MCLLSSSKRLFFLYILNIRQYHDIKALRTVHLTQHACMCAYYCIQHNVLCNCGRTLRLVELTPSCDPSQLIQLITCSTHLVTQVTQFLNRRTQLVLPPSKWSLSLPPASPPKPCQHLVLYPIRTASHSSSLPFVPN